MATGGCMGEKIEAPVLPVHGEADWRVDVKHFYEMRAKARRTMS